MVDAVAKHGETDKPLVLDTTSTYILVYNAHYSSHA